MPSLRTLGENIRVDRALLRFARPGAHLHKTILPDTVLPSELYTAEQVRAMDRHAIEQIGIPGLTLMERAGAAAFAVLRERWPEAKFLSAVCGGGNNGGDGYVIARLAHEAGRDVRVYATRPPDGLRGDARLAFQAYRDAGGAWLDFVPMQLEHAEVIVDALFGTGLDRPVTGTDAAVIEAINGTRAGVLAVDIPSGLHADSGAVLGSAVRADVTVSFIGLKRGLFTGSGPARCGSIVFDALGTPDAVRQSATVSARLIRSSDCRLPRRRATAHKGAFGHVLVIGGNSGYGGAAHLAAAAAARVGAGLVSVAAHPVHAPTLNATRPELMCRGIRQPKDLQPLLERATVLALGPGLGQDEWSHGLFRAALSAQLPLVVDADALNLLAREPLRRDDWVLTPHPGEAARLLGTTTADIGRDRFGAIAELHARYGGVVVLKGAGSLVLGPDPLAHVCGAGNPGMASGGMGDVLTGVVAGLKIYMENLTWLDPAICWRHCGVWSISEALSRRRGRDARTRRRAVRRAEAGVGGVSPRQSGRWQDHPGPRPAARRRTSRRRQKPDLHAGRRICAPEPDDLSLRPVPPRRTRRTRMVRLSRLLARRCRLPDRMARAGRGCLAGAGPFGRVALPATGTLGSNRERRELG